MKTVNISVMWLLPLGLLVAGAGALAGREVLVDPQRHAPERIVGRRIADHQQL